MDPIRIASLFLFASGVHSGRLQWRSDGEAPCSEPASTSNIKGIAIPALLLLLLLLIFIAVHLYKALKSTKASFLLATDLSTYTTDESSNPTGNHLEEPIGIRTYTKEELANYTNHFSTEIGKGMSGFVYRADLPGGRVGAVKRATNLDCKSFNQELSVLLRLPRHPNLVDLFGLCLEEDERFLVFEYIANGSLFDRLHKNKGLASPLSWAARMDIAYQIAGALKYLHEKANPPILHRDVKSANVLLVEDNSAKLADFGLSKLGPRDNQATFTDVRGSRGYIDPLYINTGRFSSKSDVYSFGVLLLELVTGLRSLHHGVPLAEWTKKYRLKYNTDQLMTIVDPNLKHHINIMEMQSMIKIANHCLGDITEERPSMKKVVNIMQEIRKGNAFSVDGDPILDLACSGK